MFHREREFWLESPNDYSRSCLVVLRIMLLPKPFRLFDLATKLREMVVRPSTGSENVKRDRAAG